MTRLFTCLFLLCSGASLWAQSDKYALTYLSDHYAEFGLLETDVRDLRISDAYASPGGVEHVYVEQYHQGILVWDAQAILHYRQGALVSKQVDLATGLAQAGLPASPSISADAATVTAARTVAAAFGRPIRVDSRNGRRQFTWPAVSSEPLTAELTYLTRGNDRTLAWLITIDRHGATGSHYAISIDAVTGRVMATTDLVLHCSFGPAHQYAVASDRPTGVGATTTTTPAKPTEAGTIDPTIEIAETTEEPSATADGATYLVFPFGVESPIHGNREAVTDAADEEASPFGWHDTNGEAGPEYTITRGNNAYAYPDRGSGVDNDDTPDGEEVDGGPELTFTTAFDTAFTADLLLPAALVQAFYSTNSVHDWVYHHGFDEAAGNFQENNYGRGGRGGDPVQVEVQDGTATNNANFSLTAEGRSPRMQMMLFDGAQSDFQVVTPEGIAGTYRSGQAQFGPDISIDGPYQAEVALADDGTESGNLACSAIANDGFLRDKIALITRGNCSFSEKVHNAENAGALGVIVCNNQPDQLVNMAAVEGFPVTIPSVFLTREDCFLLREALAEGEILTVRFEALRSLPFDSDFDAGILTHEYGHGVSSRLVGGPNNRQCVVNDESMGEGWSDFFTLASTPFTNTDTPDGTDARGIGTYSFGQDPEGQGIRTQRYSTDFEINDKVYNDIIFTGQGNAPHPVGEIWAAVLWDVYWFLTDKYGMDPDLINGNGGNNRAVRLVIEGMKYTACSPGMLDARDGILEANRVLFDGEDHCALYELFARRGMGFSAVQGSTADRTDNQQSFDISPYCTGDIELTKTVGNAARNIEAGDEVSYSLSAFSYRETTTKDVIITDLIPQGMTLLPGSIAGDHDAVTIDGNTLTFTFDELEFEEDVIVDYRVTTDENFVSGSYFFNGAETDDDFDSWIQRSLEGNETIWEAVDTTPYSGNLTYYIVNNGSTHDQALELDESVELQGNRPALRFFTKYDTEPGWDAGIVEVSTDGSTWTRVLDDDLARGAFRGEVADNATEVLRGAGSFWGDSDGFQEIIVDLAKYAGQSIRFRFRFVEDANTPSRGWWVDNIELIDVANYESPATLTSGDGDNVTASVGDLGVVAYGELRATTNTTDPALGKTTVRIYPNPAEDVATVSISAERAGTATVQLLTLGGRLIDTQALTLVPGPNQSSIATVGLPAGMYIVQVTGAGRVSSTKLTVR